MNNSLRFGSPMDIIIKRKKYLKGLLPLRPGPLIPMKNEISQKREKWIAPSFLFLFLKNFNAIIYVHILIWTLLEYVKSLEPMLWICSNIILIQKVY